MNALIEFITFTLLSLTILISTRPKKLFNSITFKNAYIFHAVLGVLSCFSLNLYITQFLLKQNVWLILGMMLTLFSGIFGLTSLILKYFPKVWQFRDKYIKRSMSLWIHRLSLIIYLIIFISIIKHSLNQQNYPKIAIYFFMFFLVSIRFFYYQQKIKHNFIYKVKENEKITHNTNRLILEPISKSLPALYNQFIFIQSKNELILKESHPFSVVNSSPQHIELLIKQLGDETNHIDHLTNQSTFYVEGSYNNMSKLTTQNADLLIIAGGIGISPFIGQLENLTLQGKRKVHIIWSVSYENDLFDLSLLKDLNNACKQFSYSIYVTREPASQYIHNRLDCHALKKEICHLNEHTMNVILSTSYPFSNSLHKDLVSLGVKTTQIYRNDFLF